MDEECIQFLKKLKNELIGNKSKKLKLLKLGIINLYGYLSDSLVGLQNYFAKGMICGSQWNFLL